MKTVLITGANGFVGRHLSKLLVAKGWNVRGAVRSPKALAQLVPNVTGHIIGSIGKDTVWDEALQGVDSVVHLAARVHVLNDQVVDPLSAYREVNVAGTQGLLQACSKIGVRRFLFMSSVKAIGEGKQGGAPYFEGDPYAPEDPYGISKAEAERLILETDEKPERIVLRPPMVYGPGVKANLLRLMRGIEVGLPWPLATVRNKRSMVYVKNLADAVYSCLTHSRAVGQAFFVADNEILSTPDLIRELARYMDKHPRLISVPVPVLRSLSTIIGKRAEIERLTGSLTVSTEKIKRDLGWVPPWSVFEGLEETVEAYRKDGFLNTE